MSIATQLQAQAGVNTESKMSAWAATCHAAMINDANIGLYTKAEIAHGERMRAYVVSVFPKNRVYLNYRKNFIAIKVEGVSLATAQTTHANLLEDLCALSNVTIKAHGENVIFRVTRTK